MTATGWSRRQLLHLGGTPLEPLPGVLDVYVNEGLARMVDDSLVYMRGFGDAPSDLTSPDPRLRLAPHVFLADGRLVASRSYPLGAPVPLEGRPDPQAPHPDLPGQYLVRRAFWASFFPDRTIVAEVGSTVRIRVHNRLAQAHELLVDRVGSTAPIAPGATAMLEFPAPPAGTYIYRDPGGGSVERLLGLHGVLVVIAPSDQWRLTPGGTEFERQWVWMCQDVDPEWGERARAGETIDPVATPPVPRYFMLNDASGFRSLAVSRDEEQNHARHEDTLPSGSARHLDVRGFSLPQPGGTVGTGQVIRMVNLGAVAHQMHFHGNHVWTLRRNGKDLPRSAARVDPAGHAVLQQWEDVVELPALDSKDVMLPLRRPPEALDAVWDARDRDWDYPMHCHAEPSQTAAGGLYPGGLVADWTLAAPGPRRADMHPTFPSQAAFAADQPHEARPVTEFRQRPDKTFIRKFFSRRLRFPDGAEFEIWSFEDETSGPRFPAPVMRVDEGDIVHVELKPSKRVHTIHHHGMEPDPRNDGVGHTSFEVSGSYTYQWRPDRGEPGNPNQGAAGTYFYHCHVNTTLHVQMGMGGALVIDPVVHPDHPVPAGARRSFVDGPLYDVATEALIAPVAIDPRWHSLAHAAGLSGEDVGLNRFEPTAFYIVGGPLSGPASPGDVIAPERLKIIPPDSGHHPTLLRVLNLNYFPSRAVFTDSAGNLAPIAEIIAHDGRPFRDTSRPVAPARPIREARQPLITPVVAFGAAERYDMLLHPPRAGTYFVTIQFISWTGDKLLAARRLPLIAQ